MDRGKQSLETISLLLAFKVWDPAAVEPAVLFVDEVNVMSLSASIRNLHVLHDYLC